MALPSSGALKLSDIKSEFGGGTPPANFRAFLKDMTTGAGYVNGAGGKIDYAPNVPSSGDMKIRDFLGAAKNRLVVTLSTTSVSGYRKIPPGGAATSEAVTASVSGGSGSYTYSWSITYYDPALPWATSPTSATTTFRATLSTVLEVIIGTAICTVTDTVSGFVASSAEVSLGFSAGENPGMNVGLSNSSPSALIIGTGTASVSTTATAGGGTPGYTYSWAYVSGDSFTIGSPTSAGTSFSSTFSSPAARSGVYRCTATDAYGQTAYVDATVTLTCNAMLSVSLSHSSISASVQSPGTATTGTVTATASGGTGTGYTYAWAKVSGTPSYTITGPTSAATTFSQYFGSASAAANEVIRCTVYDSRGNVAATADVTVTMSATAANPSAYVSPTTVTGQGSGLETELVYTDSCTVTASGGTPGYTYLWDATAVGGASGTCNSRTSATTTFRLNMAPGTAASRTWRCVVTDAESHTCEVFVNIEFSNE